MLSTTHVSIATDSAEIDRLTLAATEAAARMLETSPDERVRWLRAAADAFDASIEDLVPIAREETSLSEARLTGEVERTTGQLRHFAEVVSEGSYLEASIDHATPETSPPRPDLRRILQPLGPVAVFSAGNFPFAFSVAGGDTASALAAGCPVVVKAHPGHPRLSRLTADLLAEALAEGGAPDGSLGMVEGLEPGVALVRDPAIKAVGFTGSLSAGRALFDAAMTRPDPIPFYGELGSLNPVLVSPGADSQRSGALARGLIGSFTLGVGQFCTKPGFVFVPERSHLERALVDETTEMTREPMLNDATSERFRGDLASLVGLEQVAVVAGDPDEAVVDGAAAPVIMKTSVADITEFGDQLLAECFGPVTVLVEYSSEEELLKGVKAFPGSLTFTFHAEPDEIKQLEPILQEAKKRAGRLIFDGWPTGVSVTWAQNHGGPWPSTTASLHTSVGATAIRRFLRPVAYQDMPAALLPLELQEDNPLRIPRREDGQIVVPA